jgi:hypothetical protein
VLLNDIAADLAELFTAVGSLLAKLDTDAAHANDVGDLRTQFAALLAKLDSDTGVEDTDYAATLALAQAAENDYEDDLEPAARTHLAANE